MKRISPSLFILIVSLSLGLACAKKVDDAQISNDVKSKFSQDSGLSTKQISIQANAGVVTLDGTVDNPAQRDAAVRQAGSVPGVKTVISNLQIGAAPAMAMTAMTPAPAADNAMKASKAPDSTKPAAGKKPSKSKSSPPAKVAKPSNTDDNDDQATGSEPPMQQGDPEPAPAAAVNTPPTPTPPPPPKKMIVDQGTQLTIRLVDAIDSEKNQTGDTFHATLNAPITSDGEEAIPAGSDVVGHLVEVKSAGKFAGQSMVSLQLDSLTVGGKTYNLQTDQYKKEGSSRGKNTAEKVGGGAAIGAIIGAIAGGGKGAAIGAAAGGGVGGGVQAATKGQQIKLPSETVLNFTLQAPVTVIQAPSADANRPKLDTSK